MRKVYLDENTAIDVPPLMSCESMLFNPRSEKSTYCVNKDDLFLVIKDGEPTWIPPREDEFGMLFKDVVRRREEILTLAIPIKFLFEMDSIHLMAGYFNWSAKGIGFGQMSFSLQDGKVRFDTECMGPETTRKILHDLVDFMVDNGTSEDWDRIAKDRADEHADS